MIRRVLVGAMLVATLTACGDDSPKPPQSPLNNGPAPGPVNKKGGDTKYQPGVEAKSLSCDKFAASEDNTVESAAKEVVPTIEAKVKEWPKGDAGLACAWDIYTPGTDTESANRGLAIVSLNVIDAWEVSGLTGQDGEFELQQAEYEDYRKNAEEVNNGKSENNEPKHTYKPSEGVGKAAYVVHTETTYSDGKPSDANIAMDVLRDLRPYKVEVRVGYVIPQDEEQFPVPDKALDKAMRDEGDRQRLVESIARSLLAKVG